MYHMTKRYGQCALITGASSGIGKTFARALAKEGMNIILVARREDVLNTLASQLQEEFQVKTQVIAVDLIKSGASKVITDTIKWPVDLLVNNAGYGSYGEFQTLDVNIEENMVDLNCRQVVSLTHALLPNMIKNKRGGIICLASVVSHVPSPYMATYSASKAFNRFFALSLAGEVKHHNIDVLALCPGDTVSEFRHEAHFDKKMPIPQRTSEDVVNTALSSLGKKYSVTDGVFNKLMGVFGKLYPEKRLVRFNAKTWRPRKAQA